MFNLSSRVLLALALTVVLVPVSHAQEDVDDGIQKVFRDVVDAVDLPGTYEQVKKEVGERVDLDVKIEATAISNDNLAINSVDLNADSGDVGAKLSAGVDLKLKLTDDTKLGLGYKINQTLYQDFTDFDFRSQLFTAKLDHKVDRTRIGVIYNHADSVLDEEAFLKLHRISPYAAKFVTDRTYARLSYGYINKRFEDFDERDADEHLGRLDVYHFLDGRRRYLVGGYELKQSDAEDDPFDYLSHSARVRFVQKIELFGRKPELQIGTSFEKRDYDNITPSINEKRDDTRYEGDASIKIPLFDTVYTTLTYSHEVSDSNVDASDYSRNIVSLTLGAEF